MQTPAVSKRQDTIVAPASAPGRAAIGVIRVDGPDCWQVIERLWSPVHSGGDKLPEARKMVLGKIFAQGDKQNAKPLDEIMLCRFEAPHSYTGNNLVEIYCHGSPMVLGAIVEAVINQGARMAEPGEFTQRAFINGKMDLAQAEAVANLIAAQTREAGKAALAQLAGGLSQKIAAIRESLLDVAAEIEARLDFPEEEIEAADAKRLAGEFEKALGEIAELIAGAKRGRLYRDGVRVAIVGKPNAGKSSLFNRLVGMERAIVTPHPGTTRDSLEAVLDIRGVPVVLIDTAGLRELPDEAASSADDIEKIGIARSMEEIQKADLVLLVVDRDDAELPTEALRDKAWILVKNKIDLSDGNAFPDLSDKSDMSDGSDKIASHDTIAISALKGSGLEALEESLMRQIIGSDAAAPSEGVLVTNLRHAQCLREAREALERSFDAFQQELSGEFTMVDLYLALESLGKILGLSLGDAILDRIFNQFCIGK